MTVKPLRDQFTSTPHDPEWVPQRNDAVIVRATKQDDRTVPHYTYWSAQVIASGLLLDIIRVKFGNGFVREFAHEDVRPLKTEDATA